MSQAVLVDAFDILLNKNLFEKKEKTLILSLYSID